MTPTNQLLRGLAGVLLLLMAFPAGYLDHPWVTDVMVGVTCTVMIGRAVRWGWERRATSPVPQLKRLRERTNICGVDAASRARVVDSSRAFVGPDAAAHGHDVHTFAKRY